MGSTILLLRHIADVGAAYGEVSVTGHLERVTMVIIILTMLLVAFGGNGTQTSNGVSSGNQIVSSIFAPFPSFCGSPGAVLQSCSVKPGDIIGATAFVATAILYPAILGFTAINRVIGFGSAIQGILTGPTGIVVTVPYLGMFFVGLLILASYELFRMARGNASGGTM